MTHVRHAPRRLRSRVRPRVLALASEAPEALRIPITNVYGGGDYTAAVLVGSQKKPANVILDTGSSTFAVAPRVYNPSQDKGVVTTSLAQVVLYGTGGWAGPVLQTTVGLGSVSLRNAFVALTEVQERNNFGQADGILGLAYNIMNNAFDVKTYLQSKGAPSTATYPWPAALHAQGTQAGLLALEQAIEKQPQEDIDPYFAALEDQNVVANKFAFYTLRSFPRVSSPQATTAALTNDPLNRGFVILGGGPEQSDLYTGSFAAVTVVDDLYYNVNLKAVQVGSEPAVTAAALQPAFVKDAGSNAIVDSGTNSLVLANDVYGAILSSLEKMNPKLAQQFKTAAQSDSGVASSDLQLATWPTLSFVLQGPNADVTLRVAPSTYWQVDAPTSGRALLAISGMPSSPQTPNQSILGLPLLNNYYTVFDRSSGAKGTIFFAPIKAAV